MKTDQCQTVMEIMDQVEGVSLHEKKGGKFYFPVYVNKQMEECTIESLDLSIRSYHCLKRAGYNTVAKLAEAMAEGPIFSKIRGCGAQSKREIQERMFTYQYEVLSPERRKRFLKDVVEMNIHKRTFDD